MLKQVKKTMAILLLFLFVVSWTATSVSADGNIISIKEAALLPDLQKAARSDPARPQGGMTPGATHSVYLVERALVKEGLLNDKYSYDCSYGTATINAYKKWQKSIGSTKKYCDGIPGEKDLTKLGNKYNFVVYT